MAGGSIRDVTLFLSSYFLFYAAATFKTFSALFFSFFFLDENMIIIMTLLGKIFGKRK